MIKSIEDYLRVGLVCFRSFFKVIENVLILQSILVSISFLYLIRSGSEVNNLLSGLSELAQVETEKFIFNLAKTRF